MASAAWCYLVDNFIGELLKLLSDIQSKCLSGLQIDNELVFCGRLYREVDGLFTLKNAISIRRSKLKLVPHLTAV
jgi:hypothetical protein